MNSTQSSRYSYQWTSPNGYQKLGPKQFATGWRHDQDVPGLLDRVAGNLRSINGGQLWRFDKDPVPRPDVCEGALELTAWANYSGPAREQGRLNLQATAQPSRDGKEIGLFLTVMDYYGPGMTWMQQVSETIVAHSVLHVGDAMYFQVRGQNSTENPCLRWAMLMGGWRTRAAFQYGPWWIDLV
jgi:hypothetical protein